MSTGFVDALRWLGLVLPERGFRRGLVIQTIFTTAGTAVFITGSAVFFTTVVGLSAGQVGVILSVAGLAALLFTVPSGLIADRLGLRRCWRASVLVEAALFLAYPFVRGFAAALAVATAVALVECVNSASRHAYNAEVLPPEERVAIKAQLRAAGNIGWSVGVLLCGAALSISGAWPLYTILLLNAASYLVDFLMIGGFPTVAALPRAERAARRSALTDRSYLGVSAISSVLGSHQTLLAVTIPLVIVDGGVIPRSFIAWFTLLNTTLVILFQTPASRNVVTAGDGARVLRRCGLTLALGCALAGLSSLTTGWLAVFSMAAVVCVLTLAEMWQSAGQWGVSYALAPPGRRAEYTSVNQLTVRVQQMLTPAAFAWLAVSAGLPGWLVLAFLFLVLGTVIAPVVAIAEADPVRQRTSRTSPPAGETTSTDTIAA